MGGGGDGFEVSKGGSGGGGVGGESHDSTHLVLRAPHGALRFPPCVADCYCKDAAPDGPEEPL